MYLVPSAVLDPRIGHFVDNLPPLSSVFNRSQQTITSQPGPLRYGILPTCSCSSSSLTRSKIMKMIKIVRTIILPRSLHENMNCAVGRSYSLTERKTLEN